MSLMPIVKWCTKRKAMALFTRRNLIQNSSVFHLNWDSTVKKSSAVQLDFECYALGSFMHTSESPTCRLRGKEVIAQVDMVPGDELTYDPKQTS